MALNPDPSSSEKNFLAKKKKKKKKLDMAGPTHSKSFSTILPPMSNALTAPMQQLFDIFWRKKKNWTNIILFGTDYNK